MDKRRSAIREIIKRPTINTIAQVIKETLGVDEAELSSVRAMLALAWLEGAHMALWMPYIAAEVLVGSEEVFDLVRDIIEGLVDEFNAKEAPETTSEEKDEEIEIALTREDYIPLTNLTKGGGDLGFLTYFLKEN